MVWRNHGLTGTVIAAVLLLASTPARAQEHLELTSLTFHELDAALKSAEGRPNEQARIGALKAYLQHDYGDAILQFQRAAYFADKYSQHSLSLMYWHGMGVAADPVQAYIWADLAAERGGKRLLLIREKMWSEMTPAQREKAVEQGADFYTRYGDAVAKPRAEGAMRRFADNMTGSRLGYDGQMTEFVGRPAGGTFAPQVGSMASLYQNAQVATREQLYGGDRRNVAAYWAAQDHLMEGQVEIGPVTPVREQTRR